jgi:heme-degrading monooxygenase HmoA
MIARAWAARATTANAPAYARHLQDEVIPTLRSVDGYQGARLLQRHDGDQVEIVVVTWWDSLDSIRDFAGDDIGNAVVTGEAACLLSDYEERVLHYELVLSDEV